MGGKGHPHLIQAGQCGQLLFNFRGMLVIAYPVGLKVVATVGKMEARFRGTPGPGNPRLGIDDHTSPIYQTPGSQGDQGQ